MSENANKWISVKNGLPHDGQTVLTNLGRTLLYRKGDFLGDPDSYGLHSFSGVTHWMTFPEMNFNQILLAK